MEIPAIKIVCLMSSSKAKAYCAEAVLDAFLVINTPDAAEIPGKAGKSPFVPTRDSPILGRGTCPIPSAAEADLWYLARSEAARCTLTPNPVRRRSVALKGCGER